jgi:HK97 gp10 family phage protein
MIKIRIVGLDRAKKAFEELPGNLSGKQLLAGVVSGALLIRNRASSNAPFITGTLRRSLHVGGNTEKSPGFNPGEGYSDIGGETVLPEYVRVEVGTNLVYAARVEYGFSGKDKLGRTYNQPPNPYLRSAFDQEKEAAVKEIDQVLDALIKRSMG